jgi:hypothetical protein
MTKGARIWQGEILAEKIGPFSYRAILVGRDWGASAVWI